MAVLFWAHVHLDGALQVVDPPLLGELVGKDPASERLEAVDAGRHEQLVFHPDAHRAWHGFLLAGSATVDRDCTARGPEKAMAPAWNGVELLPRNRIDGPVFESRDSPEGFCPRFSP